MYNEDFAASLDDTYCYEPEAQEQTFVDSRAVAEEVLDYAFTFGGNHVWPLTGKDLFKNYVKLRGTFDGTRNEMNRRFGDRWAMQYRFDDKFKADVEKYGLAEIRLENTTEYK